VVEARSRESYHTCHVLIHLAQYCLPPSTRKHRPAPLKPRQPEMWRRNEEREREESVAGLRFTEWVERYMADDRRDTYQMEERTSDVMFMAKQ
jgi:hypothetical protein